MSEVKLTQEQAYEAMFHFLEELYNNGFEEELGGILGSLSLLEDGESADPAMIQDWESAVKKVLRGKSKGDLELKLF